MSKRQVMIDEHAEDFSACGGKAGGVLLADVRWKPAGEVPDPITLREAVTRLYYAARWTADRPVDHKRLWEDVRDAAGLVPGNSPPPFKSNETILQEAQRLVHGDRGDSYGHPIDDFTRTGRLWAAILGVPEVTPVQVGLCMAAMRISRQCNKAKRDNMTDLAGYAETVQMVVERQEEK